MKNKITKISYIAFLFASLSVNAQTPEQIQKIVSLSNTENSDEFIAQKTAEAEERYRIAVEKAKEKGLPISGVNEKGQAFTVYEYHEPSDKVINRVTYNNTATSSSIKTIKAKYLHDRNVIGTGLNVGVWDGGVARRTHLALTPRVQIKDNGNTGMNNDGIYHATHVSGTVASSGNGPFATSKGIAPGATIYAYNWTNDEAEMAAAARQGMLVSNHSYGLDNEALVASYGVGIFGRYTTTSRSIDQISNDYPYYTQVWAAGNDRDVIPALNSGFGGKDLLVHEGTAKNNIVVAAINGIENYTSRVSVTMSSFSNWGPTDDFRVKPDISAKGVNVLSLSNVSDTATSYSNGTSMASPAVTGGVALWQNHYHNVFGEYMRSSTVRALMAHTAMEAGPQQGPDHMYGWGVLNIEGGAILIDNVGLDKARISEETLVNGETKEFTFTTTGGAPLIATIAWNDPKGVAFEAGTNISTSRLINDLDLRIVNLDTNVTYLPYRIKRNMNTITSSSANETGDNTVDNIEKVEILGAPAGNYKVSISHKGNQLTGNSQIFSLIITGNQGALSVEEKALNELKIYPNPMVDFVTIEGDLSVLKDTYLAVYDQAGRLVAEKNLETEADFTINMSDLSSGVYMFSLENKGATKSYKVVKK